MATERSAARPPLVAPRRERSVASPQPQPRREASSASPIPRATAIPREKSVSRGSSSSRSRSSSASSSKKKEEPKSAARAQTAGAQEAQAAAAQAAAAQAAQAAAAAPVADPAAALAAMGALDPMQVPVPPELAAPIYSWVRRLALQADLAGADRVLRDALLELTSSLSASIVYPGQDGLWSLGTDDEIPRDAGPIIAVAQARRAIISSHTALIPVVTSSETVAVVMLTRNPRNPGYHPVEQIAMVALVRESAAIMHHLAVQHIQKATEIKADQGSLYRGEALEAHRSRGQEGSVIQLSPGWVRRAYPLLVITLLIAVVLAIFITVPTYSSGVGVVVFEGAAMTSPVGGTVDQILVQPGQEVKKGDLLVKCRSEAEAAELSASQTDLDVLTQQYLLDQNDPNVKAQLATASTRVEKAKAAIALRMVRALKDGTVSDIRIRPGAAVQPGEPLLTIVAPGTEPEVLAFLPGTDRPRLRAGMTLQMQLHGYTKTRERATIKSVANDVISGNEAGKFIGASLADSLRELQGKSWVIVKARLPTRKFKTEHRTYQYHHGMPAKTEVKVQSKPFLVTLLPALEKYLPD